jgi:fucose permease
MKTPQRKGLAALFFLFGFGIISWVPRFPEIKHNLHLSNGQFGTLISAGAIGSLISLLTIGHLVYRVGARKALTASATLLFGALALIVHAATTWQFLLCNVALGAGISAFHISVNGQAFHEQGPSGETLIPRLHGFWSAGALSTAILSGFLTSRVPLTVHIDVLAVVDYAVILILLRKFDAALFRGSDEGSSDYSLRTLISSFRIDWVISIGLTCSTMLEFAIGDWATIFAKEDLDMSAGVSTIPYILFAVAMIMGRLTIHRITPYIGIEHLVRRCVSIGGATFIAAVILGVQVGRRSATLGFVIIAFGIFIAGLGSSFLAPTFMDAANHRSLDPGGVVLGQLGVIQTIFIFMIRGVIAWTAQLTSIAVALMIPALMLIAVAFTANALKKSNA